LPRVSVVIPAYNHGRFVGEAIQSVLDQTFQDFELIVVDDGSTDHTREVVTTFPDPRVRYIYQSNRGQAAARNAGILASGGEYVAFLDDDDVWLPTKLELQVQVLDSQPNVALVCSDLYVFDEESGATLGRLWHDRPFHHWIEPEEATRDPLKALLRRGCFIAPTVAMARRESLIAVWGFDESLERNHEDWDLFVRFCQRFAIAAIDVPLARNRQHSTNTHRNWVYMCESSIAVYNKALREFSLADDEIQMVERRLAGALSRYGRSLVLNGDMSLGRQKLVASIKVRPRRTSPYVWLVGSLLGPRPVLALRSSWRRLKRGYRRGLSLSHLASSRTRRVRVRADR